MAGMTNDEWRTASEANRPKLEEENGAHPVMFSTFANRHSQFSRRTIVPSVFKT
jgi:hypothetical protein